MENNNSFRADRERNLSAHERTKQLLIIADDLSGAIDSISSAIAGLSCHVTLGGFGMFAKPPEVFAWSIDIDTRRLEQKDAARLCVDVTQRYATCYRYVYKKIDSMMRGHIAAEIAAMVPLLGVAIVAPAFPDLGRVTLNGRQHVSMRIDGRTGQAQKEIDIAGILAEGNIVTATLGLKLVRSGKDKLAASISEHVAKGVKAIVCDAQTNDDLARIAIAAKDLAEPFFMAGSAGLARQFLLSIATQPPVPVHRLPHVSGSILIVVGSASCVARAQVDQLRRTRDLVAVHVPKWVIITAVKDSTWDAYADRLRKALETKKDVILLVDDTRFLKHEETITQEGAICTGLSEMIGCAGKLVGSLVCTGGETCRKVLGRQRYSELTIVIEIEVGVPLSIAHGDRVLPVVTKAGSFGTVETLVNCYDYLAERRSQTVDL